MDPTPDLPARQGRPPKFTAETRAAILKRIEEGNYLSISAEACGVSYAAFKQWIARGASPLPEDAEFAEFRDAVRMARAKAEADAVRQVKSMVDRGEFKALEFYLSRSAPRRWAKKSEKTVNINQRPRPIVDDAARRLFLDGGEEVRLACMKLECARGAHHRSPTRETAIAIAEAEWNWRVVSVKARRELGLPPIEADVIRVTDDPDPSA